MKSNHWFVKLVVIVAAFSLVITALAPLVYLIAPQVSAPDPASDTLPVVEEVLPPVVDDSAAQ